MNDNTRPLTTVWFLIVVQGVWHALPRTWHCKIAKALFRSWTSIAIAIVLMVKQIKCSSKFSSIFFGKGKTIESVHTKCCRTLPQAQHQHTWSKRENQEMLKTHKAMRSLISSALRPTQSTRLYALHSRYIHLGWTPHHGPMQPPPGLLSTFSVRWWAHSKARQSRNQTEIC